MADEDLEVVSTPLGRVWFLMALATSVIVLVSLIAVMSSHKPGGDGNPDGPGFGEPTSTVEALPDFPETDVDAADYESTDQPGYYRFNYKQFPVQECAIFPTGGAPGPDAVFGVSCAMQFPANTPPVSEGPLQGPPNQIVIRPPDGPKNSIGEAGPGAAQILPWNHRIAVGGIICMALAPDGIDCQATTGGFRYEDGELTVR